MCGKKANCGLLAPEIFYLFGFPILFTRSVPDEGYFRNVSFALN